MPKIALLTSTISIEILFYPLNGRCQGKMTGNPFLLVILRQTGGYDKERYLEFTEFLKNAVVHERNLLENWNDGLLE